MARAGRSPTRYCATVLRQDSGIHGIERDSLNALLDHSIHEATRLSPTGIQDFQGTVLPLPDGGTTGLMASGFPLPEPRIGIVWPAPIRPNR